MNEDVSLAHPSAEKLRTFGLGQLAPEEASVIEQHVSVCETCCRTLAEVGPDTLVDLLRAAPRPAESAVPSATLAAAEVVNGAGPPEGAGDRTVAADVSAGPPALPPELADHPRYRVLDLLGAGGMGAVYKAEHRVMERTVALKVMARGLVDSPLMAERFRREVKAAARLTHPNIVTAFDAEWAGGLHLLVMEYVEGTDLARVAAERGPLPAAEACDYVRQAARGLQHAFEHGMVHRDIKPHNLMLTPQGVVKILDFGLARLLSDAAPAPDGATSQGTAAGTVLGTVDYMAPEQADDAHQADTRSDIYSLGCTLYHLLSGRPPFPQGTLVQKILAHTRREPDPLAERRPDLPPGLARVVERMMAKDPARRYQTPAEVCAALEPFVGGDGTVAVVEPLPRHVAAAAARRAGGEARRQGYETILDVLPAAPRPRRRWPIALAGLALLMFLGGLIAAAVAVYRIQTDNGELVITTDNPDVEVVIKQNGKLVRVIDTRTNREVKLDSGFYELELRGEAEGLRLSLDKVTIRRGETVVATVVRRPKVVAEAKVGEVRRFVGHTGAVRGVAYSPDGKFILSCSGWPVSDNTARLWDVATGKEVRQFVGHEDAVIGIAFSPDGRSVLTGSADRTVRLWERATGKEIRRFEGHKRSLNAVAFSPDGRRALSGSDDTTVRLWDVETGNEVRRFNGHQSRVFSVAFSPDGRQAASGAEDGPVRLWDVGTGKELKRFDLHGKHGAALAYSPDGRSLLSGSADGIVRLWDVETGKEVRSFSGHTLASVCLAFSKDGRRALTGSPDTTVRLWDVETGRELHRFNGHEDAVWGVAFSPDGRFAVSGSGGSFRDDRWFNGRDWTVRLWRLPVPANRDPLAEQPSPPAAEMNREAFVGTDGVPAHILCVNFAPTGRYFLAGGDAGSHSGLRVYDGRTGKRVSEYVPEGEDGYSGGAFSPDGKKVVAWFTSSSTLHVFESATGKLLFKLEGHKDTVSYYAAFSPDGKRIVSGAKDKTLRVWDAATGNQLLVLEGHTDSCHDCFSPDGKWIVSGSDDNTVRGWDAATGKEVWKQTEQAMIDCSRIPLACFSPDGSRLLTQWGDTAQVSETATGKVVSKLKGPDQMLGASFLPDGRQVMTWGKDRVLRFWDAAGGKEVRSLDLGEDLFINQPDAATVSPDGRLLVTTHPQSLRVRELATGKELHRYAVAAHQARIPVFSPDGRFAASGSWRGWVHLWRLPAPPPAKLGEVRRMEGDAGIIQVALSRDGRLAASARVDGTARLWDVNAGKELHVLRGHTNQVYAVAFRPDGRQVLTGSEDRLMKLWDGESGKEVRTFEGHTNTVTGIAFSPDGKQALSGSWDHTLRLWDVETGKELRKFEGHTDGVQGVAFSADGLRAVSCGFDRTVRLWDVAMGVELLRFGGHGAMVRSAALSPDGRRILSGTWTPEGTLRLWDIETGREVWRRRAIPGGIHGVAFSPDGRRALVCGQDVDAQLWDVESGQLLCRLHGHTHPIICNAVFSADGRFALTGGGGDKTLRLWQLPASTTK